MKQYFSNKTRGVIVGLSVAAIIITAVSAQAQEGETSTTVNVSQNTIVVVPTPQPNEPADAVLFYITDDRLTAAPGELVTYRIVVRNQRNDDINEIKITARIPDYVIPNATSPEAEVNPAARTLTWNNINLGGRAEQTYAIRAQITPDAPADHIIRTVAEINGPGVRGSFTDSTEVADGVAFQVAEEAATTAAPAAVTAPAPAITPTAPTGPVSTLALAALTIASGAGLISGVRFLR